MRALPERVEQDLPREIEYLRRLDDALRRIMDAAEMPDRLAEDLVMFIRQNHGSLAHNRCRREYAELRDHEARLLEDIVRDAFDGDAGVTAGEGGWCFLTGTGGLADLDPASSS